MVELEISALGWLFKSKKSEDQEYVFCFCLGNEYYCYEADNDDRSLLHMSEEEFNKKVSELHNRFTPCFEPSSSKMMDISLRKGEMKCCIKVDLCDIPVGTQLSRIAATQICEMLCVDPASLKD